jgi:hypothetical protein
LSAAAVEGLLLFALDSLDDARRRQEETSARLRAALATGDHQALADACNEEIGRLSEPVVTAEHVARMRAEVR